MLQRVMITAGASGIGLAIAKAFIAKGAKVHICDVDERALADVTRNHPQIIATRVDVSDEEAVDGWFNVATKELGGLDVLVNNAGIKGPTGSVEEITFDDWRECLNVCLDSSAPGARCPS